MSSSRYGKDWSHEEHLIAFNLYCKLPFGKLDHNTPEIIELSKLLGRTPDSLSMKLCNFARLDPSLQARGIKGLSQGAKGENEIWELFSKNPEKLAFESAQLMAKLENKPLLVPTEDYDDINFPEGPEKELFLKVRVNQRFFRDRILSIFDNTCCVTGIKVPSLLVASHIVPWSESVENRLNPRNGLCLNALHDRAFDRNLMWLDESFQIHFSSKLKPMITEEQSLGWLTSFEGKTINLPNKIEPDPILLKEHEKTCRLKNL
ncbi:MAG: HNH endonuclease signature motif containing protein [Victivallales bacterium]|jgi:putative restriction endonuclease